jgi:hypothetical protein
MGNMSNNTLSFEEIWESINGDSNPSLEKVLQTLQDEINIRENTARDEYLKGNMMDMSASQKQEFNDRLAYLDQVHESFVQVKHGLQNEPCAKDGNESDIWKAARAKGEEMKNQEELESEAKNVKGLENKYNAQLQEPSPFAPALYVIRPSWECDDNDSWAVGTLEAEGVYICKTGPNHIGQNEFKGSIEACKNAGILDLRQLALDKLDLVLDEYNGEKYSETMANWLLLKDDVYSALCKAAKDAEEKYFNLEKEYLENLEKEKKNVPLIKIEKENERNANKEKADKEKNAMFKAYNLANNVLGITERLKEAENNTSLILVERIMDVKDVIEKTLLEDKWDDKYFEREELIKFLEAHDVDVFEFDEEDLENMASRTIEELTLFTDNIHEAMENDEMYLVADLGEVKEAIKTDMRNHIWGTDQQNDEGYYGFIVRHDIKWYHDIEDIIGEHAEFRNESSTKVSKGQIVDIDTKDKNITFNVDGKDLKLTLNDLEIMLLPGNSKGQEKEVQQPLDINRSSVIER